MWGGSGGEGESSIEKSKVQAPPVRSTPRSARRVTDMMQQMEEAEERQKKERERVEKEEPGYFSRLLTSLTPSKRVVGGASTLFSWKVCVSLLLCMY
jgi:hypothetical protein